MKIETRRHLLRGISALFKQYVGEISPTITEQIADIPKKAAAEAQNSYHEYLRASQIKGESFQECVCEDVPIHTTMDQVTSNNGFQSAANVKKNSRSSLTSPQAEHSDQIQTKQARNLGGSITALTQPLGRNTNRPDSQYSHNSRLNSNLHAQHQQGQQMFEQNHNGHNWHSNSEPANELSLSQEYSIQQQFPNMGSIQPNAWDNLSPQHVRPAFSPWPPTSRPCPRPGTAPPIASMSQYGDSSNHNAYWTQIPTSMPFENASNHQSFLSANVRRSSYSNSPSTQGCHQISQPSFNFSQAAMPDQNLFSAPQHFQNYHNGQQQFNIAQAQPLVSMRNLNPFGVNFPSINENAGEGEEDPDYKGLGQNMDHSA
jgi:hypothetical protein